MLVDTLSEAGFKDLQFDYYTPDQINVLTKRLSKAINSSIFHINVLLNENHDKLCSALSCYSLKFEVIVLSEIWTTNMHLLTDIFRNYKFFYELSLHSKVGSVGIFVKDEFNAIIRDGLKSNCSNSNFEHL